MDHWLALVLSLPTENATARMRAPFDGRIWKFKDDQARFEMQAGTRFLRIQSRRFGDHLYRITRVIGGRTREDFAGVEVTGTQSDARINGDPHNEVILPVSYFFETASFRLKGYSVMVRELQDFVKAAVAPYKYPRAVEFRDALPRTETGKLQRFRLRSPG